MQALAAELGPELRTEPVPGLVIPRLAGAGGNWLMPTGPTTKPAANILATEYEHNFAGEKGGTFVKGKALNLLTVDEPTLMTEWHLYNLRLPCYAVLGTTEPAVEVTGVSYIVTATMNILIDGEVVWNETKEVALAGQTTVKPGEGPFYAANFTFGADLQNPLIVPNGRQLAQRVDASINGNQPTLWGNLRIWYNASREKVTGEVPDRNQGTIQYFCRDLTGHRSL